jgi:hypothetical protein
MEKKVMVLGLGFFVFFSDVVKIAPPFVKTSVSWYL